MATQKQWERMEARVKALEAAQKPRVFTAEEVGQ